VADGKEGRDADGPASLPCRIVPIRSELSRTAPAPGRLAMHRPSRACRSPPHRQSCTTGPPRGTAPGFIARLPFTDRDQVECARATFYAGCVKPCPSRNADPVPSPAATWVPRISGRLLLPSGPRPEVAFADTLLFPTAFLGQAERALALRAAPWDGWARVASSGRDRLARPPLRIPSGITCRTPTWRSPYTPRAAAFRRSMGECRRLFSPRAAGLISRSILPGVHRRC
jgi:hypothetical protein